MCKHRKTKICSECANKSIMHDRRFKGLAQATKYELLYDALYGFITTNTVATYVAGVNNGATYSNLLSLINTYFNLPQANGLKVVAVLQDGTIMMDTSRNDNSYTSFLSKSLGENNNTRLAVMQVQLFAEEEGYETKWSTTVGANQVYVALRLGNFRESIGSIRLSMNV